MSDSDTCFLFHPTPQNVLSLLFSLEFQVNLSSVAGRTSPFSFWETDNLDREQTERLQLMWMCDVMSNAASQEATVVHKESEFTVMGLCEPLISASEHKYYHWAISTLLSYLSLNSCEINMIIFMMGLLQ
jgi:hypothetical protein